VSATTVRNIFSLRSAAALVVVATALAVSIGDADARRKRVRIGHGAPPPFSHIVLDAKSGKVLEAFKADERRYPASLTKVMTLYLLFEQLEAGKLHLNTPLTVSRYASARPPSKLGLRPGSTIRVDEAIKAIVTRSANDVAVVIAESVGGSEGRFAKMMTDKAHALGMSRTHYANASGLPNPNQITTAHDQAILGRAIQERFPRQYRYFSTSVFNFRGHAIRNHNHLLGTVAGVDGIKTGYTNASGYNLVSSVRRNHRHIVAVVLGGRTSRTRDAFMRKLIGEYIDDASTGNVASNSETKGAAPEPKSASAQPSAPPVSGTAQLAISASDLEAQANGHIDTAGNPVVTTIAVATVPAPETRSVVIDTRPGSADAKVIEVAAFKPVEPTPVIAKPAAQTIVAAAPAVQAAPVTQTATAPVVKQAAQVAQAPVIPVSAVVTAGMSGYPASFTALLVVFVGCFGSFLSALWLLVSRFMPQRRMA
jgi:D-alanyl-D-alanine carboxypeptidase